VIDLDALKAELEAAGFTVSAVAAGVLFASKPIRDDGRRVEWCVSSEGVIKADARIPEKHGWGLVPFDERTFAEYAIIARHVSPQPSPNRAALLERMAQTIRSTWVDWEIDDTAGGKTYAAVAAEAGLAAVEAAGGWPRVEPVTDEEITESGNRTSLSGSLSEHTRAMIVRDVLAALPERHRAIVLGSRGITVEGAK